MDQSDASSLTREETVALARGILDEVGRVMVGQRTLLERMVIGLLVDGHILLEGVPGLAKTLAVETLATAVGGTFRRVQFTPDLLPTDLLGTHVYDRQSGEWKLREGPVFGNLVLADEINRAPAKVQSALLEAMQERSVSLGGETRRLPDPFLVLATQNPLEQEGTYPLPEAQLDRFLMKIVVEPPSREEEREIIARMAATTRRPTAQAVTTIEKVRATRAVVDAIHLDERVVEYVLDLVETTRAPDKHGLEDLRPLILHGASPRASLGLTRAARAHALLDDRDYVTPHDVKAIAREVLRHRVLTSFEAEAEGVDADRILTRILETVPVP